LAAATTSRLVLGQEAVDEKSNEITATPALSTRRLRSRSSWESVGKEHGGGDPEMKSPTIPG
jgi:hypothetical protein